MIARDNKRCPTHPGELLRDDILPSMEYSKTQLAKMLGISRQRARRGSIWKALRKWIIVLDPDAGRL